VRAKNIDDGSLARAKNIDDGSLARAKNIDDGSLARAKNIDDGSLARPGNSIAQRHRAAVALQDEMPRLLHRHMLASIRRNLPQPYQRR
jgi:hypothetical protein